jgi:hypothetical protein
MMQLRPSAFPELRRVFTGYLHEDLFVDGGTPEAALRAFRTDASPEELKRFQQEAERFLAHTATLEFDEVRGLVHQLGCRWIPPSREALVALLHAPEPPDPRAG